MSEQPHFKRLMIGYTSIFISFFTLSIVIPKKILTKVVSSLLVFGFKSQVRAINSEGN